MTSIQKFLDEQKAKGLKDTSIKTYSKALVRINAFKSMDEITKDDYVLYFRLFGCSGNTRMSHSIIIKRFFTDIGKEDVVSWIKPKRPHETIKSDDILNGEDVNKMLEATDSIYWKALIATLYETGAIDQESKKIILKQIKKP